MSAISIQHLSLHFPGHDDPLFEDLSLSIDTGWRCGLVGRNGRGKTSLLHLLARDLEPDRGTLAVPVNAVLCPRPDPRNERPTRDAVRDAVAPFSAWARELELLAADSSTEGIARYQRRAHEYESLGGYDIDSRIEREFALLGLPRELLDRAFSSLSGGEQTRAMIVALFLHRDAFPLLDEPTDHLDLEGRSFLASYLRGHQGFLLASHDRDLLDACTDHTVAINPSGTEVFAGPYSAWKSRKEVLEETERRTSEKIEREVRYLQKAARDRRTWSFEREAEKKKAADSGFVSARAARQMKSAKAIEGRIDKELKEKEALLKDRETVYPLRIPSSERLPETVLRIDHASVCLGERVVFEDLSLELRRGERLAVCGPNGCGKTTLLRLLSGFIQPDSGNVHRPPRLTMSIVAQHPEWTTGTLKEHLLQEKLDTTRFLTVLGALGVEGGMFDQPLESLSYGQLKKVEIARALVSPADLHLWDEPTNAIDLYAREELERAVLRDTPTLLFIDHDAAFIRAIATRVVRFVREGDRWTLRED